MDRFKMRKVGVNFYETFFQTMTHYGAVCFDMEKKILEAALYFGTESFIQAEAKRHAKLKLST